MFESSKLSSKVTLACRCCLSQRASDLAARAAAAEAGPATAALSAVMEALSTCCRMKTAGGREQLCSRGLQQQSLAAPTRRPAGAGRALRSLTVAAAVPGASVRRPRRARRAAIWSLNTHWACGWKQGPGQRRGRCAPLMRALRWRAVQGLCASLASALRASHAADFAQPSARRHLTQPTAVQSKRLSSYVRRVARPSNVRPRG